MKRSRNQNLLLLFGGILPVVAFAIVEDQYGVVWGTIAGMIFGVSEIVYEKLKHKKVSGITWFSNALILILGGVSIASNEGVWFKLQPALLLVAFGFILLGSSLMKKPFLVAMAKKQNPDLPAEAFKVMGEMNLRLSIVFFLMAGIAVWAALSWSTEAWAFLKSVGIFVILLAYMVGEVGYRKFIMKKKA